MSGSDAQALRVLVADGRPERLRQVSHAVASLGHEVITLEGELETIAGTTATEHPDLAVVIVGESSDQALAMIGRIVHEAACPVIAVLDVEDPAFVNEAARRGIFAYVRGGSDPDELQSSIDITLQRFAEYQSLQGAFGRRAVIEQAKGILMATQGVSADQAFELLREHSQRTGHKLAEVADSVVESHLLLAPLAGDPGTRTGSRPWRRRNEP